MGTTVHCESLFPVYHHHSMRDLNNECRWPLFYGESKTSVDEQSYNDKDVVRRTMLEHEAVFKAQVSELHRVYRIQKDMMDELKRKQFSKEWDPLEASCSSQATNDDVRKWKNSVYNRPSVSVVEDNGHSQGVVGPVPWQNIVETLEVRPKKIRRKMIDLCRPADEYIDDDNEEVVELKDHRVISQLPNGAEPRGYGSSSRSNGLADLNEPFKGQETNEFAYGYSSELRNGEFQSHIGDYGKALNSGSVREHVPVTSENGNKPKVWPHQPLIIGKMNHPLGSSSQPMQVFVNSSQKMMSLPNSGPPRKPVLWRERTFIDLEADTDTNTSHEVIHESSFASRQPHHLFPYNPPDSAVPWNHLHSSWQNPSFVFPQRVVAGNAKKQGCLGDRLQFESNGGYNHNMFYNDCSSSSSKSKFSGTGYPNGGNTFLNSNVSEVKFVRDLNLNVTFSNTSVVEVRKDEEHLATLPWLVKTKSVCNSDVADGKSNDCSNVKVEAGTGNSVQNLTCIESLKSGSCSDKPETEKINTERDKVRIMLDINEPCEPLSDAEEQAETKVSVSNKCRIDLNMSVSEEEEDETLSVPTSSKTLMIDLETVPVEEDDDVSEFETIAAETIIAISSACLDREELEAVDSSETIILHWFAETVENLDQKIDYFESMTLQLPEITEEEYMPKPLVPEDLITLEETSGATATVTSQRPRRGNARKGKQRRDFQRDTLPGLVSLSKHEVTEDIHMFDGLMRAAGSSWTPNGLARKKTGSRGRPRRVITIPEPVYYPVQAPSVQQHVANQRNNEDGSFAGWGNMTRKPRRQRCPSSTVTTTSNQRHAPFT